MNFCGGGGGGWWWEWVVVALHRLNHERPHVAIFSSRRACLRLSCPIPPLVRAMPPAKYGRSASSGGTGAGESQPLAGADPDLTPKHGIDGLVGDWLGWRKMFVVRAQTLSRTHTPRPQHKTDQRAWHTYRQIKEMELCSRGGSPCQSWPTSGSIASLIRQGLRGGAMRSCSSTRRLGGMG